jgi:gamma-glutamylaminecyclotransferase
MMKQQTEESGETFVAVYGSLKQGYGNHGLLERGQAELIGLGTTSLSTFEMISFGAFPGLIINPSSHNKVGVEVYKVNELTFNRLDGLEGYPHFYNRDIFQIELDDKTPLTAWMYYLNEKADGNRKVMVEPDVDGILRW